MKTSLVALVAAGFITATGAAALACNWHEKQGLAHAPAAGKKEETVTTATPVDPTFLARMEARERETGVPAEPADKQ